MANEYIAYRTYSEKVNKFKPFMRRVISKACFLEQRGFEFLDSVMPERKRQTPKSAVIERMKETDFNNKKVVWFEFGRNAYNDKFYAIFTKSLKG